MTVYVAPIVEGHTEAGCIEPLLQRVWNEHLGRNDRRMQVLPVLRAPRDQLVAANPGYLQQRINEVAIKLASKSAENPGSESLILLLLDSEADEPVALRARLPMVAKAARTDMNCDCVLAVRSFEAWLMASAESLAVAGHLNPDAVAPRDCDAYPLSAARWLTASMNQFDPPRKYKKAVDAARFVPAMDLTAARTNSPSFATLCQVLASIPTIATVD